MEFEPGAMASALNFVHDTSLNLQRVIEQRTRVALARRDTLRADVTAPEALAREQRRIRAAVENGIGGPVETPRDIRWTSRGGIHGRGFTVDRVLYRSADHVIVPALLYRPDAATPEGSDAAKRGAVFVASGHWPGAKAATQYQRLCRSLARAGLVVLIPDPIGQGERLSYLSADGPTVESGVYEHTYAGVQCWWNGESSARYFVRDALAGISLLAELEEVDAERIGVTGDSGGGTLTTLLMALDPRLAAAAPAAYVTSRGAYLDSGQPQDAEQILLGGTEAGVDHADLLLSLAPRPVLVLAAEDDFFPFEGTVASVAHANSVLRACGERDIELRSWPVEHSYSPEMVAAATAFFAGGDRDERADDDADFDPFEMSALEVTDSGQVLLDFPDAETIFDATSARRAEAGLSTEEEALVWLRGAVLDRRTPAPEPFARWFPVADFGTLRTRHGFWYTEEGVFASGLHVFSAESAHSSAEPARAVAIVLRPEGTDALDVDDELWARVTAERDLLILDTRLAGALAPHERDGSATTDMFAATYKLGCDLLWLGDSLGAGRAFDVWRTRAACRRGLLPDNRTPTTVELHGVGADALTVIAAALVGDDTDDDGGHVTVTGFAGQEEIFDTRDYDVSHAPWRQVITGFARHFDTDRLVRMLGDRLEWDHR